MNCSNQSKSPLSLNFYARTKIKSPCQSMNVCTGECVSVHRNMLLERETESGLGSIRSEQTPGENMHVMWNWLWSIQCIRTRGALQGRQFCTQIGTVALSSYSPCLAMIISHFPVLSFPTFESKLY